MSIGAWSMLEIYLQNLLVRQFFYEFFPFYFFPLSFRKTKFIPSVFETPVSVSISEQGCLCWKFISRVFTENYYFWTSLKLDYFLTIFVLIHFLLLQRLQEADPQMVKISISLFKRLLGLAQKYEKLVHLNKFYKAYFLRTLLLIHFPLFHRGHRIQIRRWSNQNLIGFA